MSKTSKVAGRRRSPTPSTRRSAPPPGRAADHSTATHPPDREWCPTADEPSEDVDLAEVDIRLTDGSRLTEDAAAEIVAEVQARTGRAGRPSLTGTGTHSPHVSFRVPVALRAQADDLAAADGVTVSQLARRALQEYVAQRSLT